jgi:aminoglycoside 6'-N-acetyltransferase I
MEGEDRAAWRRMREALWPEDEEDHAAAVDAQLAAGDERAAAWIAFDSSGRAVGFAEARMREFAEGCTSSPVAYLEGIWVEPAVRHRGVARALVQALEDWGRSRGCSELASDAESDNIASQHFHKALGFEVVAEQICFYKEL